MSPQLWVGRCKPSRRLREFLGLVRPGSAVFDPGLQNGNFLRRKCFVGLLGHALFRIGRLDALDEKTLLRMSGDNDWAITAACEDADAYVDTQSTGFFERIRVAVIATIDQDRTNVLLEVS